jgi:hypothetical protein
MAARQGYEAFSWCAVSPTNPRQDPSHGLQANHYWAVERWHQTLKNRILDLSGFNSAPSVRLSHLPFEGDRTFPAQRWVPSAWIVEAVDIFKDCYFSRPACLPSMTPDQLGLDGFEERLNCRIIIAIAWLFSALLSYSRILLTFLEPMVMTLSMGQITLNNISLVVLVMINFLALLRFVELF